MAAIVFMIMCLFLGILGGAQSVLVPILGGAAIAEHRTVPKRPDAPARRQDALAGFRP
jgi:hypothetical protein